MCVLMVVWQKRFFFVSYEKKEAVFHRVKLNERFTLKMAKK